MPREFRDISVINRVYGSRNFIPNEIETSGSLNEANGECNRSNEEITSVIKISFK